MKPVALPTDREIFEGEIASYWLEDNGILVSVSKRPRRTVANIRENVSLVKQITANKIPPLLIYLTNSPVPDAETRKFVNQQLPSLYKAMAMVSKPGLAKFIINFLFRFTKPPIPMKQFSDDKQARAWLEQFL